MKRQRSSEKGQILVIFVFALIALLGFTALAIDGGMLFTDRRFSQAAADASSLAGAGAAAHLLEDYGIEWNRFSCTAFHGNQAQKAAYTTAKSRGASNAFSDLDNNLSDNHGIKVSCVNDVHLFDKHIDVQTKITSQVSTAFIHLFFSGDVKNTVDAVARIRPRTNLAYGFAIASLGSDCESKLGGTAFDGTSDVYINGGGVFSNSCMTANGGIRVHVTDGENKYFTTFTPVGGSIVEPAPSKAPLKMPLIPFPDPPTCTSDAPISHNGSGTINPGNYSSIRINATNQTLTMNPGLYCLAGNFVANGGTLNANGVTIYLMKNGSDNTSVTISGGVEAHMSAPDEDADDGSIPGILIYTAPDNMGAVSLQGNATSTFYGAVYAQNASIEVGGTSGILPTYNTQLIGKYVKVHGNAEIDINFNEFTPWTDPPRLDQID